MRRTHRTNQTEIMDSQQRPDRHLPQKVIGKGSCRCKGNHVSSHSHVQSCCAGAAEVGETVKDADESYEGLNNGSSVVSRASVV